MKFTTQWDMDYWMDSNGFFVGLNTPPALKSHGEGESEITNGLPPYEKRRGFLVDEYPACPKDWMLSEGNLTSYFAAVSKDRGMWLDFNKNYQHKYHVAIVISVQGVNPITGLPCLDPHLEQYVEECPKCKEKFGPNRFCKKCGYKWPKQNYICTNATPNGQFWLDGFRAANGIVRQYILTQEKMKGVANNIIGKDRVFAIGISFFLSKNPKPVEQQPTVLREIVWNKYFLSSDHNQWGISPTYGSMMGSDIDMGTLDLNGNRSITTDSLGNKNITCSSSVPTKGHQIVNSTGGKKRSHAGGASCSMVNEVEDRKNDSSGQAFYQAQKLSTPVKVEKLEVGAGSKIDQMVFDDPEPLDFWRDKPESIICINYANEEEVEKIIQSGKVSSEGHKEAFLKEIPVGN